MQTKEQQLAHLEAGLPPPEGAGIFGATLRPEDCRVVLIPVPWEATTSYGQGTADGPGAMILASHQLDLEDLAFGKAYRQGVTMLTDSMEKIRELSEEGKSIAHRLRDDEELSEAERTSLLKRVNELSALINDFVYQESKHHLTAGRLVGVVGGDHSSPFGLMRALAETHPSYGVLHFDAHMDLRRAYEGFEYSHASIMNNVVTKIPEVSRLTQVGIRDFCSEEKLFAETHADKVRVYYDRDLFRMKASGKSFAEVTREILSTLPQKVYVSFDIDGLDARFCPSTGTPVPGGLDFNEATYILEELHAQGKQVIGFDLCEVSRSRDGSEWDENVGARMLYKLFGAMVSTVTL